MHYDAHDSVAGFFFFCFVSNKSYIRFKLSKRWLGYVLALVQVPNKPSSTAE